LEAIFSSPAYYALVTGQLGIPNVKRIQIGLSLSLVLDQNEVKFSFSNRVRTLFNSLPAIL